MNLNDFIYKINSPELEAHFEQFGKQFYIDADEINSIVDTLKLMSNNVGSSGFIEKKAHGIFGQEYVIAAFFKWAIENNLYSNLTQVTLAIPYASAGKTRFERIVATTEDTFIRVVGEESSAAAVLPDLPADTLELTHYLVRDNAIDNPIPVVPVGTFVEKATYTPMTLTNAGVVGSFEMDKRAAIKATGALTELGNIIKNNSTHHFPGQLFIFIDATPAGGVKLPHLYTGGGPGSITWFHPDGEDYVTQQGEVVLFVEDTVGSQTVNRRISSSLQQKSVTLDKIQDIASGSILGRLSAGDGQPEPLDWIDVLFLLGLETIEMDVSLKANINTYKQSVVFDVLFNQLSTGLSNIALNAGTISTQSDGAISALRFNRPSDIIEAFIIRGNASNADSGYSVGVNSQIPFYVGTTMLIAFNQYTLTSQKSRIGVIASNGQSPTTGPNTGVYIEIEDGVLVFKCSSSSLTTTSGTTFTITDPDKWYYAMFEVESSSSIRCKVREGHNGTLVYNEVITTNLPLSSTGAWSQLRMSLNAITKTASNNYLLQVGRFLVAREKPQFLNYF